MKYCKKCGNKQTFMREENCAFYSDKNPGGICGGAFFDMEDFQNSFHFEPSHETYLYGTYSNGCGVYINNGKWEGNVVIDGDVEIGFGPYNSLEEAKLEIMKEYFKKSSRFEL